jgi:hypothetical protein
LEWLTPDETRPGMAAGDPAGLVSVVDSTVTNSKGRFRFRVVLPDGQPTFFNLRRGDDLISLVASAGERINIMSFGDPERGYRVSGSRESELVSQAHTIMADGALSLDSISRLLIWSSPDERRRELTGAYWGEYMRIKRDQARFIVENPSTFAAIWALYEHLPGEGAFGGVTDRSYYRMVADSVGLRYPDSRYVMALKKSIEQ